MGRQATSLESIHRFSALARPLDPAWPTNLAVLVLMPVAAAVLAVFGPGTPGLADTSRLWAAASGAGMVLGTWALARELAPDDQRAAFLAIALGIPALVLVPSASLVLLFTTLALARMVSRSVGLPARVLDGVAVLLLTGWSMASTRSLGVGLVAAAAFILDAVLPGGLRRQWGFAALCLALVGVLAVRQEGVTVSVASEPAFLVAQAAAAVVFLYIVLRARALRATGDVGAEPLSARRVRWGMSVALAMAIQAPLMGEGPAGTAVLIWASIVGVSVSGVTPPGSRPDGA